jgi:cytochrome c oxidase subunit 3
LATATEHEVHHPGLQHHFENMTQQREAGALGMWVCLVTEIMFFGGMFFAYTLYRNRYPLAFASASNHLDLTLGTVNTVVLICSSLTMALAVYCTQVGKRQLQVLFLILTIVLGLTFLGIKAVEYYDKYESKLIPGELIPGHKFGPTVHVKGTPENEHELVLLEHRGERASVENVQMFFWIYFAMTGMHAVHMIIGIGVMLVILYSSVKGRYGPEYYNPVEITGLYWHFVDIVWIFLFPLLYLLGRHMEHLG